jgi:hypothetical protein
MEKEPFTSISSLQISDDQLNLIERNIELSVDERIKQLQNERLYKRNK